MRRCSSNLQTLTPGLNCDSGIFPGRNKAAYLLATLVQVDLQVFHESKRYPLFHHLQVGCDTSAMSEHTDLWIVSLCWNTRGSQNPDACIRLVSWLLTWLERQIAVFLGVRAVWQKSAFFVMFVLSVLSPFSLWEHNSDINVTCSSL